MGGRRAERGTHAWPVMHEHQGVCVCLCVHACVSTGGKWPRLHLRYHLSFEVQAPSPLLEGGVSPATTMQPESDDEPQGSMAGPSSTTRSMCGDIFDDFEVGTLPIGRLHPLNPLPRIAVGANDVSIRVTPLRTMTSSPGTCRGIPTARTRINGGNPVRDI